MHFSGCRRRAALPRALGPRTTKNKGTVIVDANHGAWQVSPFRQVCFIARYSLPSPQIGVVSGIRDIEVLGISRDDQVLAVVRRPSARGRSTGTSRLRSALFYPLLPHYPHRRFTPQLPSLFLTHWTQQLSRFDQSVKRDHPVPLSIACATDLC